MALIILPIGPAGCGKSSFFELLVKTSKNKFYRISPDDIRFEILDSDHTKIYFDPRIEPEVWKEVYLKLQKACKAKLNIFFDATNLNKERRYGILGNVFQSMKTLIFNGYEIYCYCFEYPLSTILQQNKQRERKVEEDAIAKQFLSYQRPEEWEYDFCKIFTNPIDARSHKFQEL